MASAQRIRLTLLLLSGLIFAGAAKAACTGSASINGASFFLPSGGSGSISFTFSASSGCTYIVQSDSPSWLIPSPAATTSNSGTSASGSYSVQPNSGGYRKGNLTVLVNGAQVASALIEENGSACQLIISTPPGHFTASGGSGSFSFTDGGCEYDGPNPSVSWIHVTSYAPFQITYSVDSNSGPPRTGFLSFVSPPATFEIDQDSNTPPPVFTQINSVSGSSTTSSPTVSQSASFRNTGGTANFSASISGAGFDINPKSGSILGGNNSPTFTISFNGAGQNPGNYVGSYTVSGTNSSGTTSTSGTFSVAFNGTVVVHTGTLVFNLPNLAAQQQQQFTVSEAQATAMAINMSYNGDGKASVTVSPGASNTPSTINVTASIGSLKPGQSSSGTIAITCPNCVNPQNVPVVVNGPPISSLSTLSAAPGSLTFSYQAGGTNPSPQSIGVSGSLSTSFLIQSDSPWLSASPSGGTTNATVAVSVDGSKLPGGTQAIGNLTVSCSNAALCSNSPITIPVTVNITAAPASDVFTLDLQSISFGPGSSSTFAMARSLDGSAYSKTVTLTNNTDNTLVVGVTAMSSGWLAASIIPAQVPARNTAAITVTADPSSLSASATPYSGTVVVSANGLVKNITVSLTVTGALTGSSPVINSFFANPSSVAAAGQSATLSWNVSGATTVRIDPGVGSVNNVSGSVSVTPSTSTTYVLTATNGSGSVTKSTMVTVGGAPAPITGAPKIISQVVDGGAWQSTIVVVNRGSTVATASLAFFMETSTGSVPWPLQMAGNFDYSQFQIAPHSAVFMQTQDTGATPIQGFASMSGSANTEAFGIFKLRVPGRQDQEGTATALPAASTMVVPFDNAEQNTTSMALVNPGSTVQNLKATFLTVNGAASFGSLAIPAGGHKAFALTDQFSQLTGARGVAVFTSSDGSPFTALAFRFNSTAAFTTLPVFNGSGGGGTTILSQIADGQAWSSTVVLINTSTSFANVQLSFQQDTIGGGTAPWSPSLNGSVVSQVVVPPSGAVFLETPGTAPSLTTGYATVTGDPGIQSFAIFKQRIPGRQDQEGTATAFAAAPEVLVPFDNTNGNVTTAALVNTGQTQNFQVQVPGGTSGGIQVSGGAHSAFYISTPLPSSSSTESVADFTGGGIPFSMLALRFNSSGAFTAIPVFAAAQ